VVRRAAIAAALVLAACGSFEEPSIVIDLRILAMTATPPEQVVPFDPEDPLDVEFGPAEVCALLADPGQSRRLEWSMTLCPPQGGRRCAADRPQIPLGSGVTDDPDQTTMRPCATVPGGVAVLPILQDTIERDGASGFGGIDLTVSIRVVPEGGGEDQAIYGFKSVRYSPKLPEERVANTNPFMYEIRFDRRDGTDSQLLQRGPCHTGTRILARPGETLHFVPIEPPGVREEYVIPTFEGGSRRFTENLRYQWLAGGGDWTATGTGGPRDGAGNQPDLDTEWEAPDEVGAVIPLWIIQRDERGGGHWYESCVQVMPF
jgi:hypothetical protein